jgi:type IX secretion system PorP/SprF family membrane protein
MRYVFLLCGLFVMQAGWCQDVHFSQFYNAPLSSNPALAGSMDADQRIIANYRHQWFSVPVPYETLAVSYDQKVKIKGLKKHWLGAGAQFLYDQAGDAQLNWLQLAFHGAFHFRLSDQQVLSAGLQARVGQRALEPGQLYFGDQYVDNAFEPDALTQESFSNTTSGFSSLGTGLNWFFQPEGSRTRIWAGAGVQHLNRPSISFLGQGSVEVPLLITGSLMSVLQLNEQWDLAVNALSQFQGPYQEQVVMAGARYHFSLGRQHPLAVQLGGGYRLQDAAISYIDIFYQNWRFGISYDINTSPLQKATNRNGGSELSVQYLITHVKPPKEFKICPIF